MSSTVSYQQDSASKAAIRLRLFVGLCFALSIVAVATLGYMDYDGYSNKIAFLSEDAIFGAIIVNIVSWFVLLTGYYGATKQNTTCLRVYKILCIFGAVSLILGSILVSSVYGYVLRSGCAKHFPSYYQPSDKCLRSLGFSNLIGFGIIIIPVILCIVGSVLASALSREIALLKRAIDMEEGITIPAGAMSSHPQTQYIQLVPVSAFNPSVQYPVAREYAADYPPTTTTPMH